MQESLQLDYKDCRSLDESESKKTEISRDTSAFANSIGGIIIYGIQEDGHIPVGIDIGYDPNVVPTKEWLEQVVNSRVHPRIEGMVFKQIELVSRGNGRVVYAVYIPPATARAPHQAHDKRYYKRHNFQNVMMEDYEIREKFRSSLNYAKPHAMARALLIEVRRIQSIALNRKTLYRKSQWLPRELLMISIFDLLRRSREDFAFLRNDIEDRLVELVVAVDRYNTIIETEPPSFDDPPNIDTNNMDVQQALEAAILADGLTLFLGEQRASMPSEALKAAHYLPRRS